MRSMHCWGVVSFTALLLAILLSPDAALSDDESPAILHLAFRDHIVTIESSPQGTRYSVHTSSGTLLSENLTDDQLEAAHPKMHSDIHASYASDPSENLIWAGQSENRFEAAEDAILKLE